MSLFDELDAMGIAENHGVHGDMLSPDGAADILAVIEDIPLIDEPGEIAKAKVPVYARIHAAAGLVANPRGVKVFTGANRTFRVLKFEESANRNEHVWLCEAQREVFE